MLNFCPETLIVALRGGPVEAGMSKLTTPLPCPDPLGIRTHSASAAADILRQVPWGKKSVKPRALADRAMAEQLHKAIANTKLMSPPTNCLSPIGDELMRKGLVSFLSVIESEGDDDGQGGAVRGEEPRDPAQRDG